MATAKIENFEEKSVAMAAFAKALAHPARICILRFLANKGEVPCMEIVAALPLSQPACSRHINVLREVGLLSSRSLGNQILFRIDDTALANFCRDMFETLHPETAGDDSSK